MYVLTPVSQDERVAGAAAGTGAAGAATAGCWTAGAAMIYLIRFMVFASGLSDRRTG